MCTFTDSRFSSQGPQVLLHGLPCVRTVAVGFAFVEEQQLPSWAWTGLNWSGSLDSHQAFGKLGHPSSPSLCVPYTLSLHPPANSLPSGYSSALPSAERPGTPFW